MFSTLTRSGWLLALLLATTGPFAVAQLPQFSVINASDIIYGPNSCGTTEWALGVYTGQGFRFVGNGLAWGACYGGHEKCNGQFVTASAIQADSQFDAELHDEYALFWWWMDNWNLYLHACSPPHQTRFDYTLVNLPFQTAIYDEICEPVNYCGMSPSEWWNFETQCNAGGGFVMDYPDCVCSYASPILIDVAGNGFLLTSAAEGVDFNITSRSLLLKVSWTAAGSDDAFLVLDRNRNGFIDNGSELFGNHSPQPASPSPNGFLALREFDTLEQGGNGDGIIDNRDGVFGLLRLWTDMNHNGVSEASELTSLDATGIASISLDDRESRRADDYGNIFRYRAKVNAGPPTGPGRWAYDVFLTVYQGDAISLGLHSGSRCLVELAKNSPRFSTLR